MVVKDHGNRRTQGLKHFFCHCIHVIMISIFIFSSDTCSVIDQVKVVLGRTVVGDSRFDNLSGSHLQSRVNSVCQSMMFLV